MPKPTESLEYFTTLESDRMYLYAAQTALNRAEAGWPRVTKVRQQMEVLLAQEAETLARHDGDHFAAAEDIEPIAIQLVDGMQPELQGAYGAVAGDLVGCKNSADPDTSDSEHGVESTGILHL